MLAFAVVTSNGLLAVFTLSGISAHFQPHSCRFSLLRAPVIVQNSEFCDGENAPQHLSRPKSTRKFRWFGCCVPSVKEKRKSKISRKQVQDWSNQQDVYTFHKPARRHYKRSRVIVPGIDAQFQANLVDVQNLSRFNKGYKYLLTCIDILSKHAWVVPLKTKQG